MPAISIFKTLARLFRGIPTAKSILKKKAMHKVMINERLASEQKIIVSIEPLMNYIPKDKLPELEKEYNVLVREFEKLCKKYKGHSEEQDRQLEVLMLNIRTLKLYVICSAALASSKYEKPQLQIINELLEEVQELKISQLPYEHCTSSHIISYREQLKNLEDKCKAQFRTSIKMSSKDS